MTLLTFVPSCSNDQPSNTNEVKKTGGEEQKEDPSKAWNPFYDLDQHAMNTTPEQESNLDSLVLFLIEPAKSEKEKARTLFTWVGSHLKYDQLASTGTENADAVFANRVSNGLGISNLLLTMGKIAGLEIKKEVGYAKGDDYLPKQKFTAVNHTWNTIKTEGKWGVYDASWAISSAEKIDHYWFDTPAEEYIFTHLPKKKAAQLQKNKMTLAQFEKLPNPGKHFFKLKFNSKTARRLALKGKIKEFAVTHPTQVPITVIKAPYLRELPSTKSFEIKLSSDHAQAIQVVNGGAAVAFDKNGTIFSISIELNNGPMELQVKAQGGTAFESFLVYEVVDKNRKHLVLR